MHPTRKVICFVIGGLGVGGQERQLITLANAIHASGYHVVIVCLFDTDIVFPISPEIRVIFPGITRGSYSKFMYALRIFFYLRKVLRVARPDVIVSFGDWYNSFTILATRGLERNVYLANLMGPELRLGYLLDNANRLLYRLAKGVIVQTERAKHIIDARFSPREVTVIPNGIEMYPGVPERAKEKIVISVGRLSREKGHQTLLEAFSKVDAPDWQLELVGDGPERQRLERFAKELGIKERVHFLGSQRDVWRFLAKAEIFVLPSLYEGFPNALVEAMSVPLCCVASDCVAGPREIIAHGESGFLVEPGNEGELAKILARLIRDPELRARTAKKGLTVRNMYGAERIADEWLKTIVTSG